MRLKLLYSKHLQHFKQTWNFVSLTAFWKSNVFNIMCLQCNVPGRLSSLLHLIWHEILPKLRIFPKENYIKHLFLSKRSVKLKLCYLISEIILNKWKKNSTLIENLVYTDKHSSKNEIAISSIFSSLVSQDKTRFSLLSQDT